MSDNAQARPAFVLKLETDALRPTTIVSLVLLDLETGKVHAFGGPNEASIASGVKFAAAVDCVVHSQFPVNAIATLYGTHLDADHVLDTLELSRNLTAERYHGLSDWAMRLGATRVAFRGSPHWTEEAEAHCAADAHLIARLYSHFTATLEIQ